MSLLFARPQPASKIARKLKRDPQIYTDKLSIEQRRSSNPPFFIIVHLLIDFEGKRPLLSTARTRSPPASTGPRPNFCAKPKRRISRLKGKERRSLSQTANRPPSSPARTIRRPNAKNSRRFIPSLSSSAAQAVAKRRHAEDTGASTLQRSRWLTPPARATLSSPAFSLHGCPARTFRSRATARHGSRRCRFDNRRRTAEEVRRSARLIATIISFDRLAAFAVYTYLRPQHGFRTRSSPNFFSRNTG